ncbi:MAG: peptidoglycan-binding protein [Clostridia bacterium]|nr:peptidoglycan-binding protein [Clostridia bacterium]MBR6619757.1 peptidoglycan-binding protein [Clostridia bacterium]
MAVPTIPETITVHLGAPSAAAQNVTLPFSDYIKNVASSEIYPTWPESALRANIYAIITFALNRYYTEYYRSRGYNFDITSSTQYDQKFINNREIFENISRIVDEIFNDYVTKGNQVQPYFTAYCNGTTVTCDGLSQWGTVSLAERGLIPYEILQYYYGDDINIVQNAPISANIPSYPGIILRLGSSGEDVRTIQQQLNRISANYPSIPKIPEINAVYDEPTRRAVQRFQEIFSLTPDGQVGKGTWYKIKQIYGGVKDLSELYSEGITISEAQRQFRTLLQLGDSGQDIATLQYYLDFIASFYDTIPDITIDSVFGEETRNAVLAFQRQFGLPQDGIVGRQTWYALQDQYDAILRALPDEYRSYSSLLYPGYFVTTGATGKVVEQLQTFINTIAEYNPSVPSVIVDGVFGPGTQEAVRQIQRLIGQNPSGAVGPLTWNAIVNLYNQYR